MTRRRISPLKRIRLYAPHSFATKMDHGARRPAPVPFSRRFGAIVVAFLLALPAALQAQDGSQTVLHLLDYIAVDYAAAVENGEIKNSAEYDEMREFAGQVESVIAGLPAKPAQPRLRNEASALAQKVEAKAAPTIIAAEATALRDALIRTYGIQVAPKRAPDLKRGAALYASQCAACHGVAGRGDGPAGRNLDPAPSSFHAIERMAQRSIFGLYNTITLGVPGTGMPSFQELSEDDRWALAFHVGNFASTAAMRSSGEAVWNAGKRGAAFATMANVATLSADEVRQRFGSEGVALQAYLRAHPEVLTAARPAPLEFASAAIAESLEAYRAGHRSVASQLAIQAYLEGFELIEPNLRNVDEELVKRIEREMMSYRALLQSAALLAQVEHQAATLRELLEQAHEKLGGARLSKTATFISSLVILLREGAEAILVVAAILAFLARAGRPEARRWVHAGWIAALALGAMTWIASVYLIDISGADREITEGVTALIAAAMLLYVGYWLHSKSHSSAWQKFIRDKVGGVLSGGTVWTLALISFLAVYREAFETVLFYQALSAQAGPQGHAALVGGLALASLLLIALAWIILRASIKLPLRLFFSVSGIVLVILAIVFTGQGIAALQEAGKIAVDAVDFVAVPILGIYPTEQTLAAQAAVIAVSAFGLWWAARARNLGAHDARKTIT